MDSIIEEKLNKNKNREIFECRVIKKDTNHIVLYYRSDSDASIQDITIPKGSFTVAHYFEKRGYVVWRFFTPEGSLRGTLIHLCKNVKIDSERVIWHDMILDIWVSKDNSVSILDEDELCECLKEGIISDEETVYIENTKQYVIGNLCTILQDAEIWEKENSLQLKVMSNKS